ncbi:MAG: LysE family translocator [Treponemataceae bacterium]
MTMEFLLTSLIVVLIPGTGVLYTISVGLVQKSKASIAAAIGCTLGIVPHIIACVFGISAIMNMSAKVFMTIKFLGAGYLLYLAWKMWMSVGMLEIKKESGQNNYLKIVIKGIFLNLLNPKLTLFFFSFLPQFVTSDPSGFLVNMIRLSFVFMIMTLIVFIMYGVLASMISEYLLRAKKVVRTIERGFAFVFAALAIKIALTDK